ncbi:MAG: hypothetical protein TR69_WS6001000404 [candidate division WS6 bacterium OLB20]|uniref:DUF1858 domain-containing protein n=1 Tax=candidate division WS6 bacterium OLB20 TaxID=1617426 RepID=A0A136LXL8_9BACT|nr:MAG: hypothetical protein TR69_WS6001000404 [candidate division WS6 bacterium OLB20]
MDNKQLLIEPETLISEIAELYPEVVDYLVHEYGFHCIGCFASHFETFEQGAFVHGIVGDDFNEMLVKANELAQTTQS